MNIKIKEYDRKLRDILYEMIEDDKKKILIREKENIDLFEDLEFDSLEIMIFLADIEEKFKIDIIGAEDVIEIVNSYEKLLKWLCDKVSDI